MTIAALSWFGASSISEISMVPMSKYTSGLFAEAVIFAKRSLIHSRIPNCIYSGSSAKASTVALATSVQNSNNKRHRLQTLFMATLGPNWLHRASYKTFLFPSSLLCFSPEANARDLT
eukprot:1908906-Amphidinium_carterae.1